MSVVVVVNKGGRVAIAADSLTTIGDLRLDAAHKVASEKLRRIPGGFLGLVGWSAFDNVLDSVLANYPDLFTFSEEASLYSCLMRLHLILKEHYFLNPADPDPSPVEVSQLDGLIAHQAGLFGFTSYRHVIAFQRFWAKGSGRDYALGALHTLYPRLKTAEAIARGAVEAACTYDVRCGQPIHVHTLRLADPAG